VTEINIVVASCLPFNTNVDDWERQGSMRIRRKSSNLGVDNCLEVISQSCVLGRISWKHEVKVNSLLPHQAICFCISSLASRICIWRYSSWWLSLSKFCYLNYHDREFRFVANILCMTLSLGWKFQGKMLSFNNFVGVIMGSKSLVF